MNLRSVRFLVPVEIAGDWSIELRCGHDMKLESDEKLRVVRVVHSGQETHVPFERVLGYTPLQAVPTCPECGETFMDARGLGGHRHHRHGIKSARGEE